MTWLVLALLFLSGCSVAAWEAIGEGANATTNAQRQQQPYVYPPVYTPAPIYAPRQVPLYPIKPGYGR